MSKARKEEKGKEILEESGAISDPESGHRLIRPASPGMSEEPDTEATSSSEAAVTTSCFGFKSHERIPRRRRWNSFCFSMDREAVTFFAKVSFAWVMGLYCMAMMAYLITAGGEEMHISLYFGLFTFVVGFFLGNAPKLKSFTANTINGSA
jgi:hypothetical protein